MAGGQQGKREAGSRYQGKGRAASPGPIPPALGVHHQVQQRSAAGVQQGAGNGPQVSQWPRCLIPWPGASRAAGERFPILGQQHGRQPRPDTPSAGGSSPGTAAFTSWRAARGRELASGESVAPVSDPMAGGQQGKREAGSRYQGKGRAASPGPIPLLADHHQVQQRSAAGVQQGAGNGPQVSQWPRCLIPWPEASRGSGRRVPDTRATAGRKAASREPVPDTPSAGGTSPGTAASGSWRAARGRERASGRPVAPVV
jgi:hypothetical protein